MFKENLVSTKDTNVNKEEKKFVPKTDYLMSMIELDAIRNPRRMTPEKYQQLENLNNRIDSLLGGAKGNIFQKIIDSRASNLEYSEELNQNISHILEKYDLDAKLIDLPDNLLAEILRPLKLQIRQAIFVQRDKRSLREVAKLLESVVEDSVLAFHVSDREIKNGKLQAGEKEDGVYFSTDIKRLFNNKGTKYIYAFHIPKKHLATYRYGGLDCFGKIKTNDRQGIDIEDSISIFEKGNPAYRQRVLASLGAKFATEYSAASDSADAYLRQDEAA